MSDEKPGKGTGSRDVPPPDIYLLNPDPGTPVSSGPQNAVFRWRLAPFHQLAQDVIGEKAKEWGDEDAWVLSLWAENPTKTHHFCLSPFAVADMANKIQKLMDDQR